MAQTYFLVKDTNTFFLTNIRYWADNAEILTDWCKQNACDQIGMTVVCQNKQAALMFMLRWP